MTDEQMDARLRAAGAAWRTATDDAPSHAAEPLPVDPPVRPRRTHRTAWLASAAVVAAALVAGGAFVLGRVSGGDGHRGAATESTALQGRVWRLTGYRGDQQRTNGFATLYVGRDGHLVADDTCQLVTATVTSARPSVRHLQIRNYNCTDAVGEVSFGRGLHAFRDDPRFAVSGDRLTISGGGVVMHLIAAPNLPVPTADRPTLTDATWRLTAAVDANGKQHAVRGNADLRIDGDQLSASDTCNSLSGTVKIDYPILEATGFAQTAVGCPANDTAPVVDAVLSNGAHIDFRQAMLTVTKTGAGTLTYRWQPSDEQATDPKRLEATDWQLRSIAGDPASGMTLRVADGRLELAAACATTNVPVEVGPGTLTAPNLVREPQNDCPPEWRTVSELLASRAALWRVAGNQLVVNEAGAQGFALVFQATKDVSPAAVELPGTWKLTGIEHNDTNTATGSGSSDFGITLELTGTRYRLISNCPRLEGDAALHDATIDFGANDFQGAVATCLPDGWNDAAKAVRGTASWKIQNGQLRLTKGTTTLTFER